MVGLAALGLVIATTAVVVVRAGATARPEPVFAGQPKAIAGGFFEASGVAHVPGTRQFLFLDDDRPRAILVFELDPAGTQLGVAEALPLGADVTDLEGITSDGHHFYVVGSLSKATGFDGDGLVRFSYDPVTRRIGNVERVRDLKAWLARHVPELRGADRGIGDHILNVEGLAWDPGGRRLLLGLRAPLLARDALIVPVQLAKPGAPFATEHLRIAGATIRLPIHGAGIRSIEFDDVARGFVLIAGAALNDENLDFQVLEWDGDPRSAPRVVATYDRSLKPEGLTRAVLEGRSVRVIVFDTSRFAILE